MSVAAASALAEEQAAERIQVIQSTISEVLHTKRQEFIAQFQPLLESARLQLPSAAFHAKHQEILNIIDDELTNVEASLRQQYRPDA